MVVYGKISFLNTLKDFNSRNPIKIWKNRGKLELRVKESDFAQGNVFSTSAIFLAVMTKTASKRIFDVDLMLTLHTWQPFPIEEKEALQTFWR